MATENEKLAASLSALREAQQKGATILRGTTQISRTHLLRLLQNGWLQEVAKGWYIFSRPNEVGDATSWFISYWDFVREYAYSKYGEDWCLTAEESLDLLSGKTTVPTQTVIRAPKASNYMMALPYSTSIFNLSAELPAEVVEEDIHHLRIYPLAYALVYASPSYYQLDPLAARICLAQVTNADDISRVLLETGATTRAGRIVGALRNVGKVEIADQILHTMQQFGHRVDVSDPFEYKAEEVTLPTSPYEARIQLMWQQMREDIMQMIPEPTVSASIEDTMARMDEGYKQDAYHSLSIEGYQVTINLIEQVARGDWHPQDSEQDKQSRDALVAKGYYLAYQAVKDSVRDILNGEQAGVVVARDYRNWYQQMWMPHVNAGILRAVDLVGFRDHQVYIRGSKHTPLPQSAVRPAIDTLMRLLQEEPDGRVRAVLGHFFFGFIHPYMDGNGRMSRFIMNAMWITAGFDWLIIPVSMRDEYMAALEEGSVNLNIRPFCDLLLKAREHEVNSH